jgi:hypothetical protein
MSVYKLDVCGENSSLSACNAMEIFIPWEARKNAL